uniref:Uncharacterized protein n=1 Tax=Nelumbo nucifera TaxID=4432 RepID=A0A822YJW8_NELNU|nr:TPA_asm: hypothetical protein HUJ06_011643 [Nelumbo nucifera]
MKSLNTWSVGQNIVNPPSMLLSNVRSASEATSISAKTLQPHFDIKDVRFSWLGPGVRASSSADAMTLPWLDSAPKPTLLPLRLVMLTKLEALGAEPVASGLEHGGSQDRTICHLMLLLCSKIIEENMKG